MRIFDFFLEIFFPQKCIVCGREGAWFCQNCEKAILFIKSPTCPSCKALTPKGQFCQRCRPHTSLTGIMVVAYYETPLKEVIHAYKYKSVEALADPLANLFIHHLQRFAPPSNNLVVVPVPLHPSRLRHRGFNQAELLAQRVAQTFGFDYAPTALVRTRSTLSQVELSSKARFKNVMDAFCCPHPSIVKGKSVLLIDDVCTTGATLEACASELKKAKARQIWGLVLARE